MSEWVDRSIDEASKSGYLDRLHAVYTIGRAVERSLPKGMARGIAEAHDNHDQESLVRELLKLEKFPIDDPYVRYLAKEERALGENPETVKRIGDRLLEMPVDELLRRCREPKVINRQMGSMFRTWLGKLDYLMLSEAEFSTGEAAVYCGKPATIVLLKGTGRTLTKYANEKLSCGLDTELDLLARVHNEHIIGEAKYFGDFGGHQRGQFEKAVAFAHSVQGAAIRIVIFDGVIWLDRKNTMCQQVRRLQVPTMSALLLQDYLASLTHQRGRL